MAKQEDYLELIYEQLLANGVRGLSMEQLAGRISVTKRTLYNNFGTREELLYSIIDYQNTLLREKILQLSSQTTRNALSILTSVLELIVRTNLERSDLFLTSLKENFPLIHTYMQERTERALREFFAMNIPRGRSEDLYRTDFDSDIVALITFNILDPLTPAWMAAKRDFKPSELIHQTVTFITGSIALSQ